MAFSRRPGCLDQNSSDLPAVVPGPLGIHFGESPEALNYLNGAAPGPLGFSCHATQESSESLLGVGRLHFSLSWDNDLLLWDYDPERLLEDPNLNPSFVQAAHEVLSTAVRLGLRAKIHEAFRTPEESDRKHALWKAHKGGRAAPAWRSCHNYGIAMDVWLFDRKGKYIDNHVKGWYSRYKALASAAKFAGFVWGESFGDGDADHFEFHPKWSNGASGSFLLQVKEWAQKAALLRPNASTLPNNTIGPVPEPDQASWMPYFWWAAGIEGFPPPPDFLAKNQPPTQLG